MNSFKDEIIGFRVSTSNCNGKGHLMRCLVLAKELKYKVIFFTDKNFDGDTKFRVIREDSNFSAQKAITCLREKTIKALNESNISYSGVHGKKVYELERGTKKISIISYVDQCTHPSLLK